MMILAAVLLVIGLIALAGMVARVNQLGTQTGVEADKAILDEVTPIQDALDGGIADLRGGRTINTGVRTSGSSVIESTVAAFVPQDVGRHITGTGIQPGAMITGYTSATKITINSTAGAPSATDVTFNIGLLTTGVTLSGSSTVSSTVPFFVAGDIGKAISGNGIPADARILTRTSNTQVVISAPATATAASGAQLSVGRFALSEDSVPTLERAVIAMLEQLQRIESSHGIWMDYEVTCGLTLGVADPTKGQAVVHLSDGTVWVEVRSSVYFLRADANGDDLFTVADCNSVRG